MIGEGKVKLSDKIIDYFPEHKSVCEETLLNTTIENALTMCVALPCTSSGGRPIKVDGMDFTTYHDKNWTETVFNKYKGDLPDGTIFRYNSTATYLLNVIVEKLTNKSFLEYLRPEFDEIGVSKDISCITTPDGYSWVQVAFYQH